MMVRVHPASGVPLYLQIESQVKQAIAAKAVRQDDPLPPVRKLAAELRVNPNTVARAYADLSRDRVVETLPGKGLAIATRRAGGGLTRTEGRSSPGAMMPVATARRTCVTICW